MTVFENVVFGLWARRDTKDLHDRVRNALHTVHLEDFENAIPISLPAVSGSAWPLPALSPFSREAFV